MKVHEILQQNTDLLRALARARRGYRGCPAISHCGTTTNGFARDGFKVAYIVAYLCDTYEVSERTVYRIIRRFGRDVNTSR